MTPGGTPKVVKHCAEGHTMEMSWVTCPRCTGKKARSEQGRDMSELTMVYGAPVPASDPATGPPPTWVVQLVAEIGPATGTCYAIEPGRWKVGRAPRPEEGVTLVQVADPSMSRDHFVLEAGVAAVVLRDLGSTNGTLVNGTRVERHILAEGDVIQVGQSALRVRLGRS